MTAKKKLVDVSELRADGRWHCKLCADYDTQLEGKARRHAQVKHAVELEPIVVVVPRRGVAVDEVEFKER
jgi:hypothetical protein